MGQNNDPTERGELQANQGAPKGRAPSEYLGTGDREGSNPFREGTPPARRPADRTGEDAPNGIPLPDARNATR